MFAHIDTESVYNNWQTDPFEAKLIGNKLYGLGTADDKAGIAAMLVAAKAMEKIEPTVTRGDESSWKRRWKPGKLTGF
jgi:acetylornithine deacetylase/succinyl-diaminopimelate desuccinylase-like protein